VWRLEVENCFNGIGDQGDQGKPGEPAHRNIGRGSCRSALADGVERRSTAVVRGLSVYSYLLTYLLDGGPMGHTARSRKPSPPPHPAIRHFSRRRKATGEHAG
jgi:hypothetical protein